MLAAGAYQFCGVILDGGDHLSLLRIPPLVVGDPVSIAVSAGKQSGVPGPGTSVCVIVIAIREVCAVIEKETESAFAELVAIAFKVVTAELVNHDDDDQFRTSVVSRGGTGQGNTEHDRQQSQQNRGAAAGRPVGRWHRDGSLHGWRDKPKAREI